eukprot:TRINITY_DN54340_c0_g1_i1.p1 TRINITY_DN54340_c0_g1~~TRINITY_DN54340_c0_g1_i1.p1  ORF type:complete len:329 (-),score=49.92 TRINITY_DN54340_c0_g1_i1:349-1281(-)
MALRCCCVLLFLIGCQGARVRVNERRNKQRQVPLLHWIEQCSVRTRPKQYSMEYFQDANVCNSTHRLGGHWSGLSLWPEVSNARSQNEANETPTTKSGVDCIGGLGDCFGKLVFGKTRIEHGAIEVSPSGVRYKYDSSLGWRMLVYHGTAQIIESNHGRKDWLSNITNVDELIKQTFNTLASASQKVSKVQNALFVSSDPYVSAKYACPSTIRREGVRKSGLSVLLEFSVDPDIPAAWDSRLGCSSSNLDANEALQRGAQMLRDSKMMEEYYFIDPSLFAEDNLNLRLEAVYTLSPGHGFVYGPQCKACA